MIIPSCYYSQRKPTKQFPRRAAHPVPKRPSRVRSFFFQGTWRWLISFQCSGSFWLWLMYYQKEKKLFFLVCWLLKWSVYTFAYWQFGKCHPRFQSATADDDRLLSVERRFNLSTTMASWKNNRTKVGFHARRSSLTELVGCQKWHWVSVHVRLHPSAWPFRTSSTCQISACHIIKALNWQIVWNETKGEHTARSFITSQRSW